MFFVAGIGIAVFIEFLLLSKKNKSASDLILTIWMFLILIHLFLFYIFFTGDIYEFPSLLGLEQPIPLLHGVMLYFYVAVLTRQLPRNRKLLILHFLPISLMYIYLIPFFILPPQQKIQVYENHGAGYDLFLKVRWYAIVLSGLIYVIWSVALLRKHRNNIRDQFSDLEKINLLWLRILTFSLGGIWLLVIFFGNDILIYTGVVIFIFLIGFFGVRQADIFKQAPLASDSSEPKQKYLKSGLSEETSDELHKSLMKLMAEEALYRKNDLSINYLSSRLKVHPNYLSQVINEKEKKHFYDFVNTYRIEEFMHLIAMQKNRQYTLLTLAYDCGFSSKTSFNRYFKKVTGQTPSQYVNMLARSKD